MVTKATKKAYKLVRQLKDGSLAPLFIDKTSRFTIGEWMHAKDVPTKGYAHRPGFHCTHEMCAPHLSKKDRVWIEVEIADFEEHHRSEREGGLWYTAQMMKVLQIINDIEIV